MTLSNRISDLNSRMLWPCLLQLVALEGYRGALGVFVPVGSASGLLDFVKILKVLIVR